MKARVPKQPGMGNMNQMIQQAQQMQGLMEAKQDEINDRTFEAVSGGNAVKVTFNGKKEMINVEIKPEVVDPDDIEMLEDLVLAAVNSCLNEIQVVTDDELNSVNGGMNIPGLF